MQVLGSLQRMLQLSATSRQGVYPVGNRGYVGSFKTGRPRRGAVSPKETRISDEGGRDCGLLPEAGCSKEEEAREEPREEVGRKEELSQTEMARDGGGYHVAGTGGDKCLNTTNALCECPCLCTGTPCALQRSVVTLAQMVSACMRLMP